MPRISTSRQRHLAAPALIAAVVLGLSVALPQRASARSYVMDYCGTAAVADGWTVGATSPGKAWNGCSFPGSAVELSYQTWGAGSQGTMAFTAPDNTTVVSWRPSITATIFHSAGSGRWHLSIGATPAPSSPVDCYDDACSGSYKGPYAAQPGARQLAATVRCEGSSYCNGSAFLHDVGGQVVLDDPYPPVRSGPVSGPLPDATSPLAALRGTVTLGTLITDAGSGVARTELFVDDDLAAATGNGCIPQPTTRRVPCSLSQAATLRWDTTRVSDGAHPARLVATDAAGNQTDVWSGRVLVANQPIGPGSPLELRGDLVVKGATDHASIPVAWPGSARPGPKRCKRTRYRRRHPKTCAGTPARATWRVNYSNKTTARLAGSVINSDGQPVGGAPVAITATVTRGSAGPWVLRTQTDANGHWAVELPRRIGSRNVQISTVARQYDQLPAGTGAAQLEVRSTLWIRTNTRRSRGGRRITFHGKVADEAAGVPLTLEMFYRGRWRAFRTTQTRAGGRFTSSYRFSRAARNFRFRFRARTNPSPAWPYLANVSRVVSVYVR